MTPAIDLAKKTKTPHQVHRYEHDPAAESFGDEAVQMLEVESHRVFKTLVVELNNNELAVAVVPVTGTLNLKAIASALKVKKAAMADTQKAQKITGYLLGGISPIGQKRALRTVIDVSAESLETMFVSAGRRGLEIELTPTALATLCKARFAAIAAS